MVERHARVAQAALDKAADAIDKIAPADMKASDIITWLAEAAKLERVSRGEPETIQQQRSESHVHIDVFQPRFFTAVLPAGAKRPSPAPRQRDGYSARLGLTTGKAANKPAWTA